MSLTQCWSLFLSRSLIMGLCPSKTPLVSIVIPVFNVEKYLRKCLDSLLQQTLHDIEIVCVNDCSTDTSREILSHYAQLDERICIIDLPENRKQGGARNAGIRHSHAPFITFVDSDDWIEPTMCECLYANALAHDADWVCSDYFVYNSPDDCQRQLNGHPSWFDLPRDERNKSFLLGNIRYVSALYSRSLFVDNDLFFPEHLQYEDNAVVTALYLASRKAVKVDAAFYYYRCNNTSTTRSLNNYRFFDRLETSRLFLDNMRRLGFFARYQAEVEFRFIQLFYVNTVMVALSQFVPPERAYIERVAREMQQLMPRFRQNPYYRKRVSWRTRFLLSVISLHTGAAAVNAYPARTSCPSQASRYYSTPSKRPKTPVYSKMSWSRRTMKRYEASPSAPEPPSPSFARLPRQTTTLRSSMSSSRSSANTGKRAFLTTISAASCQPRP